jgi:hypothetical protein
MKAPDPYILEYLQEEGLSSPSDIANDGRVPFGRTYINKRLQALGNREMVINMGNGMYQLTQRGDDWLQGEFDARVFDDGDQGKASA